MRSTVWFGLRQAWRGWPRLTAALLLSLAVWAAPATVPKPRRASPAIPTTAIIRRVNVPYLDSGAAYTPAIFWLGKVDADNNYADVRIDYTPDVLGVVVHIIDRRLWYEATPTAADLPNWDAVSLYLSRNGPAGGAPDTNSYRFEVEVFNNFQVSYRGDGAAWATSPITITSYTDWRGASGPNSGSDSEGWVAHFYIPYSSLGLAGPPVANTQWGLAVAVHDRDDPGSPARPDTVWPENMVPNSPSTWGLLSFGIPAFIPPLSMPLGVATIRQGLNGATVTDGAVGGYTTCGNNGANKWTEWGNHNYSDPSVNYQFNIQNEWDISDWPCFSKFYITFPITSIPAGQSILSASLTLTLLGTAVSPPNSYIEVLTVGQDWQPATLTWNDAPLAVENISGNWVPPVNGPYTWDVSRAVAPAYSSGAPLRLALYSIDGDYNTGKYFYSSESNDWGGTIRPTLNVVYGQACSLPNVTCHINYLPFVTR